MLYWTLILKSNCPSSIPTKLSVVVVCKVCKSCGDIFGAQLKSVDESPLARQCSVVAKSIARGLGSQLAWT